MQEWTALEIVKQIASELGLKVKTTIVGTEAQDTQLLGAVNSAGNELLQFYPWAFLSKDWEFQTVDGQGEYDLPTDWAYFVDQTQWDTTNRWPLLGPKSPQEWAWIRGGLVATAPRMRYRVRQNQFQLWPIPVATGGAAFQPATLRMEYVKDTWLTSSVGGSTTERTMITQDGDIIFYNPWLVIKYAKYKFYVSKGFTDAAKASQADFVRMFDSLTGKDTGAGTLSMSPGYGPQFLSIRNVPDGNWNQ